MEILRKLQEIGHREAFCINIYFMNYNIVSKKNVRGVEGTRYLCRSFNVLNVWLELGRGRSPEGKSPHFIHDSLMH